jgi:hypothetical protein
LEERLRALGFRHVLCVRSPESFEKAREDRLNVSGKPSQYDNLRIFVDEQEEYRRLIRASLLPFLELDVSDNSVPRAVDRTAGWLEATGGLHIRDG